MVTTDPTTIECWKDIPEFGGYQASDAGRLRSFWKQENRKVGKGWRSFLSTEPKILVPKTKKSGYLQINLRHDSGKIVSRRVNRLILETFVGPAPKGYIGCHRDGCKTNNLADNLRWGTTAQNRADATRHGTMPGLAPDVVSEILRLDQEGMRSCDIAVKLGLSRKSISKVLIRNGIRCYKKRRDAIY